MDKGWHRSPLPHKSEILECIAVWWQLHKNNGTHTVIHRLHVHADRPSN